MGEPTALRDILERMLRRTPWEAPRATRRLAEIWEGMAPAGLSSHCWVSSLVRGVLELSTDGPLWAQEVRMVAPELAARFNEELGERLVEEIVVTVRRRRSERG